MTQKNGNLAALIRYKKLWKKTSAELAVTQDKLDTEKMKYGLSCILLFVLVFGLVNYYFITPALIRWFSNDNYPPTASNSSEYAFYFASSTDNTVNFELKQVFAEGNCVDKALSILTILERDEKLDDSIYVLVDSNHAQCFKKEGSNWIPLTLDEGYYVVEGNDEIDGVFIPVEPNIFRKAAMKYVPNITYNELMGFYMSEKLLNTDRSGLPRYEQPTH